MAGGAAAATLVTTPSGGSAGCGSCRSRPRRARRPSRAPACTGARTPPRRPGRRRSRARPTRRARAGSRRRGPGRGGTVPRGHGPVAETASPHGWNSAMPPPLDVSSWTVSGDGGAVPSRMEMSSEQSIRRVLRRVGGRVSAVAGAFGRNGREWRAGGKHSVVEVCRPWLHQSPKGASVWPGFPRKGGTPDAADTASGASRCLREPGLPPRGSPIPGRRCTLRLLSPYFSCQSSAHRIVLQGSQARGSADEGSATLERPSCATTATQRAREISSGARPPPSPRPRSRPRAARFRRLRKEQLAEARRHARRPTHAP